jgi:hypothetical protein
MPKTAALAALALLAAACASTSDRPPGPVRVADFKPEQLRRPVVVVRFTFTSGFEDREKQAQLADYEGALLEGLNARAVLAREVRILRERDPRLEPGAALAKARELGADHVVTVEVRAVRPAQPLFCAETRRPFRAQATVWTQQVSVLRASDGALRMAVPPVGGGLEVYDLDADCENPRESKRRTPAEAVNEAVMRLLNRVVGP